MRPAIERLASRLVLAWRFTRGHVFPLRGAPDWLVHDLEMVAADERRLRDVHQLLMSKVRDAVSIDDGAFRDARLARSMTGTLWYDPHPDPDGGSEFPVVPELADCAITGPQESAESSDMRAAAMRKEKSGG